MSSPKRDGNVAAIAITIVIVGGLFVWFRVVEPRVGSCSVQEVYRTAAPGGDLLLSKELCGSNGRRSFGIIERFSLVDPTTGQRVARAVMGGLPSYLGQAGSLWFLEDQSDLTTRDPLTLKELASSDAIRARYPALGPGIHGAKVDPVAQAVSVTDNQGRVVQIDGHDFARVPGAPQQAARRTRWKLTSGGDRASPVSPDGKTLGVSFLSPQLIDEAADPPSVLIASRESLDKTAPLRVDRVGADGKTLWTTTLSGQTKLWSAFLLTSTLALVTRVDDDYRLTTLSLSDGAKVAQYDY